MGTDNLIFLEVLEWFDETGQELVHRIPEKGSGEIKYGAQLTVRESQSAVFFYQGKAYDAFGPGRHTLTTLNIPILTKVLSIPWGMTSPLRAEVYFVNMKLFPNLKWGTRDPVAFRDSELGLIRLRAHGVYSIQVLQPALLINRLVGTQGMFSTTEIEDYLSEAIVSRFNDLMGETIDTVFKLPGRYEELVYRAREAAPGGLQPLRPGAAGPLYQFHHAARRGAEGDRRQEPPGRLRRREQAPEDEGRHGPGEDRRDEDRGGRGDRHGPGAHDARLLLGIP